MGEGQGMQSKKQSRRGVQGLMGRPGRVTPSSDSVHVKGQARRVASSVSVSLGRQAGLSEESALKGRKQGICQSLRNFIAAKRRGTHRRIAAGHHDLDEVADVGRGKLGVVEQGVELGASCDLVKLVLAGDAVLLGAG